MLKKENAANYITATRIAISLVMMFFDVTSITFMALYLIASLSDILDGFVARKMNVQSELGSRLDTVSDIVFFTICLIKIYDLLHIRLFEIVTFAIVALIKIASILINLIITHSVVVDVHSKMNKATGILLFFLPISINLAIDKYYVYFLLLFSFIASIDELLRVINQIKTNNSSR